MAWSDKTPPNASTFKLRLRPDLEFYPHRSRARKVWVVKDPVSLRYFQFREEEFKILQWLDGRNSLEQIKQEFEVRFAPQRMTVSRLHTFVVHLHRNGLVISHAAGQGDQLLRRRARQQRNDWVAALSNPLAIRFRGLDPEPMLGWLYPRVRWIFSPWCLAASWLLVMLGLLLVIGQFELFCSRLPELDSLISARNLLWLAVALGMTKVLHEFGHALTCKHFGGECHELGLMLLVFTPCLYCNVTDAWKLSSRWQRVAIAGAGIYVEVLLASASALLWWFTQPGLLNSVCLNVMVVCSIGTVLLNGNPLLRYDGYYILSDLLEAPNLWQDSRARLQALLSRLFWGFNWGTSTQFQQRTGLLLSYACCSMVYRTMVLASILYLLYRILEPQGLVVIAQILASMVLLGVFSSPGHFAWEVATNPMTRRRVKPMRLAISFAVLLGLVAIGFFAPWPCRISASATIQPHEARRIYVSVPGRLMQSVAVGDFVRAGDLIARLENAEVQRELESVQGQLLRQQIRIRNLDSLRGRSPEFGAQLPAAKEILSDLEQRQAQLQRDLKALSLVAPVDGFVLPPPRLSPASEDTRQLRKWAGTPLDEQNLGCELERRSLFCLIGQPNYFEAVVFVDQSAIQYIRRDQHVRMRLDFAPGRILEGKITEVSRNRVEPKTGRLGEDSDLANVPENMTPTTQAENLYQAHVQLDAKDVQLLIGLSGEARIRVDPQTLSLRLHRLLARTFKPVF